MGLCTYCGEETRPVLDGVCCKCSWLVHADVARGLAEIEHYLACWAAAEDWALTHNRSVV